jgi:uncharacterized membrane protein
MVKMSQQNTMVNVAVTLAFSETIITPHSLFTGVSLSFWVAFSYLLGRALFWVLGFLLRICATTITHVTYL